MNQSSSSKERSLLASATKDELIVAQILLDLRILLSLSESLANSNWTRRRRRSCYDTAPPLLPEPSPATVRTDNEIEERRPRIETDEVKTEAGKCGAAARSTPSPDTPLSFSPSETDEKSKHSSRKNSRKRQSREDYIATIDGLTHHRNTLLGEIDNVKKYYNKLKAYNSQLKKIKQEVLNIYPRKEDPKIAACVEVNLEIAQHNRVSHSTPLIEDPTVHEFQHTFGPITSQLYNVGPLGFDLNVLPADEALVMERSRPYDAIKAINDQRARSAEARRKRKGIMKTKSGGKILPTVT